MSGAPPDAACPPLDSIERLASGARVDVTVSHHVEICATCSGRLSQVQADNELLAEFVQANSDRLATDRPVAVGSVPAGYEILDEIERGSQGVVYRARQCATNRLVALKSILQGAFSTDRQRRRFEREVELVASMRHPNIVTVYDSGVTDEGRPFVAMELVTGRPLDAWQAALEESDADPLSRLRRKLELFARLCDALAYAHRRGIIHRDLKPANILVDDDDEPHVLDFGLAKLVGAESVGEQTGATMAGEFLGTFAYAAPEQVAADPAQIDTRTDVYALGVILYELLAGQRPYELVGPVGQITEKILYAVPTPPSQLVSPLDRDVETIVLQALAKDPARRYQSVDALLADVRHYLAGQPIDARRDDALYVLLKTARRYRLPLLVATGVFGLVITFAVVTYFMYLATLREGERTLQTMGSLVSVLGSTDQENPDAPLAVSSIRLLLDESARIVDRDLGDLPEVAAAVRSSLGLAYLSHSQFDEAEAQLVTALELYRQLRSEPDEDIARALHNVGRLHWKRGEYDLAVQRYGESLAMRQAVHPGDDMLAARTMHHLASSLRLRGDLRESERWFREARAMRERHLGLEHAEVGNNLNGLGNCLRDQGRYEEALANYEQALKILGRHLETTNDWRAARVMHRIGLCLLDLGRVEEASAQLTESLRIKREFRPDDDPDIADGLDAMARLHLAQGNLREAETACREALAARTRALDKDHPDRLESLLLLGRILLADGRPDDAAADLQSAFDGLAARLGARHWRTAAAQSVLGECLLNLGRAEEARPLLSEAVATLDAVVDERAHERVHAGAVLARLDGTSTPGDRAIGP